MLKLRAPISVQWEITSACNKKCIHCYNYWRHEKYADQGMDEYNRWEKILDEIIRNQVFLVTITGGEPLLEHDKMLSIITRLRENEIDVNINTNLSLLTDEMAMKLREMNIKCILTSFPTYTAEKDKYITNLENGFEDTLRGIAIARKYNIDVIPNMVISKINLLDIEKTVSSIKELGLRRMSFNFMIAPLHNSEAQALSLSKEEIRFAIDTLYQASKTYRIKISSVESYPYCIYDDIEKLDYLGMLKCCSEGKNYCIIDSLGRIRSCIITDKTREEDLNSAWKALQTQIFFDIPSECEDCIYIKRCHGGCRFAKDWRDYSNKNAWNHVITKKKNTIKMDGNYRFRADLKHRSEEKGAVLYKNLANYLYVDQKTYLFFLNHKQKDFTLKTYMEECSFCENDARIILSLLLNNGIVE